MVTKKTIKFRLILTLRHECLLLKAQGTGAQHPVEQGDQDGNLQQIIVYILDLQIALDSSISLEHWRPGQNQASRMLLITLNRDISILSLQTSAPF